MPLLLFPLAADAATLALRDLSADACGTVVGVLDVRPFVVRRTVDVTVDDRVTTIEVPAFASEVPLAVPVDRGAPATLTATWWFLTSDPVSVSIPPLDAHVTAAFPDEVWAGEAFPVDVTVHTACDALPLRVELTTALGDALAEGDGDLTAVLPREGEVAVVLRAWDGTEPVAELGRRLTVGPPCVDTDGDGHPACRHEDCDDVDPTVFRGQTEILGNGKDDDCDGVNGLDADRDGFESAAVGGDDCDDTKPSIRPGGTWPDPDRDGAVVLRLATDVDCDGHPDTPPPFDCAEGDPRIPRAEDPDPNGVDEDCDGIVDEGTVAYDDDGDGLSELEGDCDDTDSGVRPGRPERPDCRDQDCDGLVDEDVVRPARDDRWEPDDDRAVGLPGPDWVRGFFGGHWTSSRSALSLVTRDEGDAERFVVDAHDGAFDSFHVTARIVSLGDDRTYRVRVSGPGGERTALLSDPGEVSVGGAGGRDDSGTYEIDIEPVDGELLWCPLEVVVSTG